MIDPILVDTGPLVAVLSERDSEHERCVEELQRLRPPLLTTWAVLTEAAWLLRDERKALEKLLAAPAVGLIRVADLGAAAFPWINLFFRRYPKLEPQFADASLVYLAEQKNIATIFTLDRRDFSIYRFGRNRSFLLLPE
jgi:predicted nucleic acid-binding protein